ncbi:MAG: hypothetical protein JW797_13470 [Bradymonadales bacterium]|nr:hypothetical protein [Bradymonadales bacterium]
MHRIYKTGRTLVTALSVLAWMGIVVHCEQVQHPEGDRFQRAEDCLHRGDYDEAIENYQAFLEQHPGSNLAPIARQRLIDIDRELEAVMGRRACPAPIYIRPPQPATEQDQRPVQTNPWDRSAP